jgi:hypothetical protein
MLTKIHKKSKILAIGIYAIFGVKPEKSLETYFMLFKNLRPEATDLANSEAIINWARKTVTVLLKSKAIDSLFIVIISKDLEIQCQNNLTN